MAYAPTQYTCARKKYSLIPFDEVRLVKTFSGFTVLFMLYLIIITGYYNSLIILLHLKHSNSVVVCYLAYNITVFMSIWCHITCMLSNPGLIPLPSENQTDDTRIELFERCVKCGSIKPFSTHHCSVCNRCIYKMNHHCPWINNCVGQFNQKQFFLFTFYSFFQCVFELILILKRFNIIPENMFPSHAYSLFHILNDFTTVEFLSMFTSLLFGVVFMLFCLIMIIDQLTYIKTNTLPIDNIQKMNGKKLSFTQSLNQFFGCKFNWTWFVPITVYPPFMLSLKSTSKFSESDVIALACYEYSPEVTFIENNIELNSIKKYENLSINDTKNALPLKELQRGIRIMDRRRCIKRKSFLERLLNGTSRKYYRKNCTHALHTDYVTHTPY